MTFICRLLCFFCLTASLVFSSSLDDYEYLFPKPNAVMVPCQSQIMLRMNNVPPRHPANLNTCLRVSGSKSGPVKGLISVASDKKTIIFKPDEPFFPGETVQVNINLQNKKGTALCRAVDYTFETTSTFDGRLYDTMDTAHNVTEPGSLKKPAAFSRIMPNGVSVPGDFPHIRVLTNTNPADGYIFICNRDGNPKYNMILENDGSPIWYHKYPDNRRDFKVQHNGNLSMLVRQDYSFGTGYIELDKAYNVVDTYHTTNGYSSDEHGIQILENGHYLLMGRRVDEVDMSRYVSGGQKNARVRETCIQEFTSGHELIFEWRAWDHFDIRDTYVPGENELTANFIRFPHMNAVDIDTDGHILLSSRHHSEVTKINRQTGEIIWRLSGPKNQFTFINDPLNGFENQHDIRNVGPNRYTVFDNGNEHEPPQTRAVEYEIDTDAMTATVVWQYDNSGDHYSHYMGNAQRLPNGNTFINWAASRSDRLSQLVSEVTPGGEPVYRLEFERKSDCYRAFRFPWDGKAAKPNLFIEPQFDNVTLGFNLFGEKNVAYYNIYGGTSPNPTTVLDTSHTTLARLRDLENNRRYYFRVTAVRHDGTESEFSDQQEIRVNILSPGENMTINGNFSNGTSDWLWQLNDPAEAEFKVNSGIAVIVIENGGGNIFDVHIRQNGLPLIAGSRYLFEFDAWADASRIIEAKVGQDQSPWINYSKIGFTQLSNRRKTFSYEFNMEDASDNNARIVFNCGTDNNNVFIDNVSLKLLTDSGVGTEQKTPAAFQLYTNYPNPFNAVTTISYDLPVAQRVRVDVYNMLGRRVETLIDGKMAAGHQKLRFDAAGLSSGVYIYQLKTPAYRQTKKMVLMR